jgi:hypothetical protein
LDASQHLEVTSEPGSLPIFSQGTLPAPPHPLGWESQLLLVQCRPVGSCLEVHIVRCCVPQLVLGERTCEAAVCLSAVHVGTLIDWASVHDAHLSDNLHYDTTHLNCGSTYIPWYMLHNQLTHTDDHLQPARQQLGAAATTACASQPHSTTSECVRVRVGDARPSRKHWSALRVA